MADGWNTGRYANNGVMLADNGARNALGAMMFDSSEVADASLRPYLDVDYDRRLGERRGFTYERFRLSDRINLAVNPGSGNMVVRNQDVAVAGSPGPDLSLSRTYNSLTDRWGAFTRWWWDTGDDFIVQWHPNQIQLQGPSGYEVKFKKNPRASSSAATPGSTRRSPSSRAAPAPRPTRWSTTRPRPSGSSTPPARLSQAGGPQRPGDHLPVPRRRHAGEHDHRLQGARDDGHPQRRADREDRGPGRPPVPLRLRRRPRLAAATTTYTDPAGGVTKYGYDSDRRLSQITTPAGRITKINYYPSNHVQANKVKEIIRVTDPVAGTGPMTQFSYTTSRDGSSTAVVTDPNSHITNYEFDTKGRPTKVTDALGRSAKCHVHDGLQRRDLLAPTNTGLSPSGNLTYDNNDNQTDSSVATGPSTGEKLQYAHGLRPDAHGRGDRGLPTWLPRFYANEQDKAVGPAGRGTAIEYDNAEGNPTKVVKGTASSVQMSYQNGADGKPGRLATTTDPRGNVTAYAYDAQGQPDEHQPAGHQRVHGPRHDDVRVRRRRRPCAEPAHQGDGRPRQPGALRVRRPGPHQEADLQGAGRRRAPRRRATSTPTTSTAT